MLTSIVINTSGQPPGPKKRIHVKTVNWTSWGEAVPCDRWKFTCACVLSSLPLLIISSESSPGVLRGSNDEITDPIADLWLHSDSILTRHRSYGQSYWQLAWQANHTSASHDEESSQWYACAQQAASRYFINNPTKLLDFRIINLFYWNEHSLKRNDGITTAVSRVVGSFNASTLLWLF